MKSIASVEEYISNYPESTRQLLFRIQQIVKENAPDSVESISYGMPAYKLNGKALIYFAGYAKHIGLYATPNGHNKFKHQLSSYKQGKGSVQFPLNQQIPFDLIAEIVRFRFSEIKRGT